MPFPASLHKLPGMAPHFTMGLPTIRDIAECADINKTILPYLPQLYALPEAVYARISSTAELKTFYATTNPAISSLAFTIATFPIFLLISEINRNYRQVDRVWSILPTLFNLHYAVWARVNGLPTQRVDHILACSVVWSLRLTYNYWRKGGYQVGSEDYRWEIIQKKIGRVAFTVLNLLFVSSWQLLILWAVTTPTYVLLLVSRLSPTVDLADSTFARIITALVVLEYFADGQMWDYQQAKQSYRATAKVPQGWKQAQMERGFCTTGLWRWSRHPNFAAEQTVWTVMYVWACWHTGSWLNWTAFGVLQYIAVFQGSTPLTEWISAGKYPEYKVYQERVGRFLPKLWGKRWAEEEEQKVSKEGGKKKN